MPATSPYEIISGPVEVYRAPVGEAWPDISEAPAGNWTLIGTSGNQNITEDGVAIRHMQTIESDAFRMVGNTGPRGAIRQSEDLEIEFVLADLKAVEYANALNGASVTVTDTAAGAGAGGNLNFPIQRGPFVARTALLIRGTNLSAEATDEADDFNMQYEIPIAFQSGEPEVVFNKNGPAALRFLYRVIEDATDGFGTLRIQDADPV
jgi:hypothetical protein